MCISVAIMYNSVICVSLLLYYVSLYIASLPSSLPLAIPCYFLPTLVPFTSPLSLSSSLCHVSVTVNKNMEVINETGEIEQVARDRAGRQLGTPYPSLRPLPAPFLNIFFCGCYSPCSFDYMVASLCY